MIGKRFAVDKYIYVNLQIEIIHKYANAPEEVSYLRYPHRHIAHIKVKVQVFDDDREIEFIMLKHKLSKWLDKQGTDKNGKSCEMLASEIVDWVTSNYGKERGIEVDISEDGENGAVVDYVPLA